MWQNFSSLFDAAAPVSGKTRAVYAASGKKSAGRYSAGSRSQAQELKEVLSTGRWRNSGPDIAPFGFNGGGSYTQAQSAGLEGFFYTKKP